MSFKKTVICLSLSFAGLTSTAMAAPSTDVTDGTVDFTGSIMNTPCTITAENSALKVDLGQVKASTFAKKGDTSANQEFTIKLVNCTVDTATPYKATVTFSGAGADTGKTSLLVGSGTDTTGRAIATGVGIQIVDDKNAPLSLDVGTVPVVITRSEMNLPFSARYVSVADNVTPGLANGHADFTVTYD